MEKTKGKEREEEEEEEEGGEEEEEGEKEEEEPGHDYLRRSLTARSEIGVDGSGGLRMLEGARQGSGVRSGLANESRRVRWSRANRESGDRERDPRGSRGC